MAVATSIDALAVGVGLSFVEADLFLAVTIIGLTTFVLCVAGVYIGIKFNSALKKRAEIFGGIALIIIACKILAEHLFF